MNPPDWELGTVEELAKYLKVSKATVYRWVKNGKIPYHQMGKQFRFRLKEIDDWIDDGGIYEKKEEFVW